MVNSGRKYDKVSFYHFYPNPVIGQAIPNIKITFPGQDETDFFISVQMLIGKLLNLIKSFKKYF